MTSEAVVRTALRALDRDRGYVVPGLGNSVQAHLMSKLPRRLVALLGRRVTRGVPADPVAAR
ncbi:short-subunit dehydrogenase [Streptosporangium lutulentum]|uniref:Short-subunit dehydrogenase n=1 Tax=Streptosporangium lutulentum TaxID=1461250 RepID=A0ABT9QSW6_9ACTN|nr:short-subunit dehydrogenase [Streptosporangium lutulentum]